MAKEIKSISVAPKSEESTINLWQSFGWEFKSTQEIKTADVPHLERRGDSIYSVTNSGDHYVKLTFERDPTRQNYAELKSLEEQYYSINYPRCPIEPEGFGLKWIVIAVIGIMFYILPGIFIIIWRRSKSNEEKRLYDEAYYAYRQEYDVVKKKRQVFLEKAKSLL